MIFGLCVFFCIYSVRRNTSSRPKKQKTWWVSSSLQSSSLSRPTPSSLSHTVASWFGDDNNAWANALERCIVQTSYYEMYYLRMLFRLSGRGSNAPQTNLKFPRPMERNIYVFVLGCATEPQIPPPSETYYFRMRFRLRDRTSNPPAQWNGLFSYAF